jgi:hypothetical protein
MDLLLAAALIRRFTFNDSSTFRMVKVAMDIVLRHKNRAIGLFSGNLNAPCLQLVYVSNAVIHVNMVSQEASAQFLRLYMAWEKPSPPSLRRLRVTLPSAHSAATVDAPRRIKGASVGVVERTWRAESWGRFGDRPNKYQGLISKD